MASLGGDGHAQDRVMARQRLAHPIRLMLPQRSATLNVGEEEGHHSAWKVSHDAPPATTAIDAAFSIAPHQSEITTILGLSITALATTERQVAGRPVTR